MCVVEVEEVVEVLCEVVEVDEEVEVLCVVVGEVMEVV